jgi:hypothetical protein
MFRFWRFLINQMMRAWLSPPVTAFCGQRRSTDVQARRHRDRPPQPA